MRTPRPERVVRFDAFVLDLSRCILLRDGKEVPLQPQAFDMLCYLAEYPGHLLSKNELLDAVWPDVTVGEDSLVKCIKRIREALGDRDQRIIKTVRSRGYLFAADVSVVEAGIPLVPVATQPTSATATRSLLGLGVRYLRTARTAKAAALAAGVLLLCTAAGGWALWHRAAARAAPQVQAGHYVILARAILDDRHTPQANKEALALFDKALALDPSSIVALLGYARAMLVDVTDGWAPPEERPLRLDQAEAAIERAIKVDPTHANAHFYRGFLWRARGEPERALAAFHHSLALNPHNPWTYAELGRNKIDVGRAEEAIDDIATAIRLNAREPRLFNWYYWAAMAAVHAGKGEIALEWLQKWREPNPLYERFAGLWLAVAYADTAQEDAARATIAAHLARVPSFTIVSFHRDFPSRTFAVAEQRERIAGVLRRLGVPEGHVQTGSAR